MEREAFLYVKAKLLNSSIANRKNFGSGEVHFNLTGTYMNDPFLVSYSCVTRASYSCAPEKRSAPNREHRTSEPGQVEPALGRHASIRNDLPSSR